jgi:hypothetical protein
MTAAATAPAEKFVHTWKQKTFAESGTTCTTSQMKVRKK